MLFNNFFDEEIPQICVDLGLKDLSYANDSAALMEVVEDGGYLWVWAKDPDDRDYRDVKRFQLIKGTLDQVYNGGISNVVIETDDDEELLKKLIEVKFLDRLSESTSGS